MCQQAAVRPDLLCNAEVKCSYPEGASLTELKHPKHTVLKPDGAVELGQVVVINTQELKYEEMDKVNV